MNNKKHCKFLLILLLTSFIISGCNAQANISDSTAEEPSSPEVPTPAAEEYRITLGFAGDICFDDNEDVMVRYRSEGNDISKCIDPEFIRIMNDMDVMWINNEFCYSKRGTPMAGKAWTFRSDTKNVSILKELGVDIAGLANNHVFDYGREAFLDTLDTLKNAGIPYVGAGRNIEEASSPVYIEAGGIKIAYVAATRAEKYILTPEAGENTPGVLRCYDTAGFVQAIKKARTQADFVIALPHWGTERSTVLEKAQTSSAREYIDAGADMVIGAHSHCLQGIEFYNGKPVIYSLGNFWFDRYPEDTMVLQVTLTGRDPKDLHTAVTIHPGSQKDLTTTYAGTRAKKERIFRYIEKISVNATVDDEGDVVEKP